MEIIKLNTGKLKNIRIRSQSKLNSKEKSRGDTCQPIQKINNKRAPQKIIFIENITSQCVVSQSQKSDQIKRKLAAFWQNRAKNKMNNHNKQNRLKIQNKNISQIKKSQPKANKQEKKSLQSFTQKQNEPETILSCSDQFKRKPRFVNFQDQFLINLENEYRVKTAHSTGFNQINQKQIQNHCIQCQQRSGNFKKQFAIVQQLSVNLTQTVQKVSVETQTSSASLYDKYFEQYIRYRQLKVKSFQQIQQKQSKLKQIIEQNTHFKDNHQNLLRYLDQGPSNDRQKRVFGLSVDLQSYETKMKQQMQKIVEMGNEFERIRQNKIISSKRKIRNLFVSIAHLIEASLTIKQQKQGHKDQAERILRRASNQLAYLEKLSQGVQNYESKIILKYHQEATNFKATYYSWSKIFFQNRVLLYNFMKHLLKTPTLMISLFGSDEEHMQVSGQQRQIKNRLEQYMSIKCEQCYHMKNKIRLLQINNQQIKPVFKSLEWLIRDCSQPKKILSFI